MVRLKSLSVVGDTNFL